MITCCKQCERRAVGCHAVCTEYIAQKAEDEAAKAKKAADYEIIQYIKITRERQRRKGNYPK